MARVLRESGLQGRPQRRYRVCTTDSSHDHPIAPNRLPDLPTPVAPNQVWATDITYVDSDGDGRLDTVLGDPDAVGTGAHRA